MFNIYFLFLTSFAAGIRVRGESGEMSGDDMSSSAPEPTPVSEADVSSMGAQGVNGPNEANAPNT